MALSKEEIKKITGQQGAERTPFYKLNEVTMSGDEGLSVYVNCSRIKTPTDVTTSNNSVTNCPV